MPESNKDPIKEAFVKAKQDIFNLSSQIELLKREIQSLKETLKTYLNGSTNKQTNKPTDNSQNKAIQHINPTHPDSPAHNSTQISALYSLKTPISNFSTGSQGVPTDRQTDRQTDNSTRNKGAKVHFNEEIGNSLNKSNKLERVTEILDSLDDIRKDIRLKLKKLTQQELVVYTTIYQLEEEGHNVYYPLISQKLNLTESSIRDYTQRIIKKGLPLQKTKENNKKILLNIPQEFKKLASLQTIILLREL